MISYALIGAISAVVELASVALASAYVAQISRRRLREKQQSWVSRNAIESQVCSSGQFFKRGLGTNVAPTYICYSR
jgi:hypothetical protein